MAIKALTAVAVLAVSVAGCDRAPTTVERFDEGPWAGQAPFSEAARAGHLLYVSGQVGDDESGNLVEGGIVPETHQVMANIKAILNRRGLSLKDVVKCTVFLADIEDWPTFNTVYTSYFERPYPARSALGANGVALNGRLELECIAAYPE